MKKIVLFGLFIISLVLITGCNNKHNYTLKITQKSWSGWLEDYAEVENSYEFKIKKGKKYKVDSELEFIIKNINKDSIVIETTYPFSDSENGIDLNTKKKEFTIKLGEEKILETPTMDAGFIYYLYLEKK